MQLKDRMFVLAIVGACAALGLGCTRPPREPASVARGSATAFSVFTDTAVYRRYCVAPTGRPVDLEQPCLLLDQGRPIDRRPPRTLQPYP
jgi:hypothetical protein